MSREMWLTHIFLPESYPSYQKMVSCYSGTFLLHLVSISSYLPSWNNPVPSHVPKPFTDPSYHKLVCYFRHRFGFNKNLCGATSLPHQAAWFSQNWISELCLSVLTHSFQQGCERLLLRRRASSLAKAVLECKAGVQRLCKAGPPCTLVSWWKKQCQRTGLRTTATVGSFL